MRIPAKFVAVLILLTFAASPGFAVMQCRRDASSAVKCGHHCAMMTQQASGSSGQVRSANPDGNCCRMLPAAPTPIRPSAIEMGSRHAAAVRESIADCQNLAAPRSASRVLPHPQPNHRSQSVLCTFLI
jgi:hypothetical protein